MMMLVRWRRHIHRRTSLASASAPFVDRYVPAPCQRSASSSAKNNVVSMQDLLATNPKHNYELAFNWERALQWWPQAAWKDALGPSFKAEHARLATLLQQSGPSNHYYLLRRHPELAKDVLMLVVDSTKTFPYVDPLHRDMDIIKVLRQMALAVGDENMEYAVKAVIHQRCMSREKATCTPCLYRSLCAATDTTSAPQLREILRHLIHHRLVPEVSALLAYATEHRIPIDVWRRIFNMFIHPSFSPADLTSGGGEPDRPRVVQDIALQFMAHVEARPMRVSEGIAASVLRAAVHHGDVDTALTCYDWFRQRQVVMCDISIGHMMQLLRPGQPHANMERFQQVYKDAVASRGVASLSTPSLSMAINAATHDHVFLRRIVGDIVAADSDQCHLDVGMCNVALKSLVAKPDCDPSIDFPLAESLGLAMDRMGITANRGSLAVLLRVSDDKLAVLQQGKVAETVAQTVARKQKNQPTDPDDTLAHAAHIAIVDLIKSGDVRTALAVRDAVLADPSVVAAFSPAMWQTMVLTLMHHKASFDVAVEWVREAAARHDNAAAATSHAPLFEDFVFSTWFTLAMKHRKLVPGKDDAAFVLDQWRRHHPTTSRQDDIKRFDLAIATCCHAGDVDTATDIWHDMVAAVGAASASAASAMLHALDRAGKDVAPFFYSELYPVQGQYQQVPAVSVLQAALFTASQRKKHNMVRDVLDLLMKVPPSEWNASVYRNALYCCAESPMGELAEIGLELVDWFVTERLDFDPDEYSLFDSLRLAKRSNTDEQYAILHAYSERNRWPGLMAYTVMMEAHLQAQAPSSYGDMIADMMAAQKIEMDVKFATVYALLLLHNHDHTKLVQLIRTMVKDAKIEPDEYFFNVLLTTVAEQADIDGCFELVAAVTASVGHFEALYMALIQVGLTKGVLERVCNVVMQMECEGFAVSSTALVRVINAVSSSREMDKVVSIVAQLVAGGPRDAPFDAAVFSALWTQLDTFSCANKVSLKYIQQHAATQGFDRPTLAQ